MSFSLSSVVCSLTGGLGSALGLFCSAVWSVLGRSVSLDGCGYLGQGRLSCEHRFCYLECDWVGVVCLRYTFIPFRYLYMYIVGNSKVDVVWLEVSLEGCGLLRGVSIKVWSA